ncbi:MAG: hypothetical protein E7060_00870 [Treponema bryantii]|nr:hypothetical protein [Treponema bryantii]
MKRLKLLFILVSCLLGLSCASNKVDQDAEKSVVEKAPKWISDQGRLELFPENQFVSQLAYGNSAQESKENASANISEYIKATVVSSTSSHYLYQENNNSFSETRELQKDVSVFTENDLFKIEYTNPYFYSDLGQFVCVAFINRNQAFNFVKPKLDNAKNNFSSAYSAALNKESLIDKIIGIKNAQNILVEFYEVYDFARSMKSDSAKIYEDVDFLANESFVKLREICSSVLMKIEGAGDIELLEKAGIIAELSNQFEKIGFVIGKSLKSNCITLVDVKSLITETPTTFETYPEISIRIIEKGEEKLSYSKKLPKVAGFDKETVVRRTNLALVNEIKASFLDECF